MKKKYFGFVLMLFFTASINSYAQEVYLDCNPAGSVVATSGTVAEMNGATAFTWEAMVKFSSLATNQNILSIFPTGDINNRIGIQVTNGIVYCIVANAGNASRNTGTAAVVADRWYHIAMVFNGSLAGNARVALYIDGASVALGSGAGTIPATAPTTTATFKVDNGNFVGNIDEVRVWNAALTQPTINTWKSIGLDNTHPNNANLKLYWNFNDAVNTPLVENGALGTTYDGAITNAVYVDSTLGIIDLENRLSPVFPNPFNSELSVTLNLSENSDVLLSLYDLEGKIIKEISKKNDAAGTNVYTIPTESISKGLYLLKIMTNDKVQTCKIIKE